ncbi:hypothetical protein D3C75_895120 [compost metagenome]
MGDGIQSGPGIASVRGYIDQGAFNSPECSVQLAFIVGHIIYMDAAGNVHVLVPVIPVQAIKIPISPTRHSGVIPGDVQLSIQHLEVVDLLVHDIDISGHPARGRVGIRNILN